MESFDSNLSRKNCPDKIIIDSGNSIRFAKGRNRLEIETRSRISVCSGLRTSELESAVSGHATSRYLILITSGIESKLVHLRAQHA